MDPTVHGCPRCTPSRKCVARRLRKCRGTTVEGAACRVCGIADSRVLRRHRFPDLPDPAILCANHAAIAGRKPLAWVAFLLEVGAVARENHRLADGVAIVCALPSFNGARARRPAP